MVDPLLALCARAHGHPVQYGYLAERARKYSSWTDLAELAEENGIAPLVYAHLRTLNAVIPNKTKRTLLALYLRHRDANSIRNNALIEILSDFQVRNIPVLILKGAALANDIYPRPGLRPMRDLDLLVSKSDALRAQLALVELGFNADLPRPQGKPGKHHLPVAQKRENGMIISVEIHQYLLPYSDVGYELEELASNASEIQLNHLKAKIPGHEDMLWHIYRHSFAKPLIFQPIRLIWVADFVSTVEKYLDQIDWARIRYKYPQLWNIIPIFHTLTPWSERVINTLDLKVNRSPQKVGFIFQGWPQKSLAEQRNKGYVNFLSDTFWPSSWWMQLYYGISHQPPRWWWYRIVRHPLHIFSWVLKYLRERLNRRR